MQSVGALSNGKIIGEALHGHPIITCVVVVAFAAAIVWCFWLLAQVHIADRKRNGR